MAKNMNWALDPRRQRRSAAPAVEPQAPAKKSSKKSDTKTEE